MPEHSPSLPTPRHYAGQPFSVAAICQACQHSVELDLVELVAGPHADTPLVQLPLRGAGVWAGRLQEREPYGGVVDRSREKLIERDPL